MQVGFGARLHIKEIKHKALVGRGTFVFRILGLELLLFLHNQSDSICMTV